MLKIGGYTGGIKGGFAPSIVVNNALETDTVVITKGGRTYHPVWKEVHTPILPDGYTSIDYVYPSSGAYFLTNVIPQGDDEVTIEFSDMDSVATSGALFGLRYVDVGYFYLWRSTNRNYAYAYVSTSSYNKNVGASSWTDRQIWKVGNGEWSKNGEVINSITTPRNNSQKMIVFGYNNSSSTTGANCTEHIKYKLHDFSVKRAGKEILHYYPCIRDEDGVAGVYDSISGEFNAGVGNFTAGEEVPAPELISVGWVLENMKELGTYTVTATRGGAVRNYTVKIDVPTRFFVDVEWTVYVYKAPNTYDETTGGWLIAKDHSNHSASLWAECMYFYYNTGSTSGYVYFYTANLVDLAGLSHCHVGYNSGSSSATVKFVSADGRELGRIDGEGEHSINIDEPCIVQVGLYGTSYRNAYVNSVWFY